MIKKLSHKILITIGIVAAITGGSLFWYETHQSSTLIYDLNINQDTQPILDLFANDSYWLDANYDSTQEKYRRMLTYGYVDDNPMYPGKLKFKVLRDHGTFVGFTAYYKINARVGKILFVAVHPQMRGKRYGEVLVKTALEELKKLGATQVELVTRTSNYAAQKLYKRSGFYETFRDTDYVAFGYRFKD